MTALSAVQFVLGLASGGLVGFSLGLIGGGGSILAVPLLLYVVGVASPHIDIGTTAAAVAANAGANLINHGRAGTVKWPCAILFAAAGVLGAAAGSSLGKRIDGEHLLALFAILMLVIAGTMARRGPEREAGTIHLGWDNAAHVIFLGLLTGALSGFFGIGGGFLIVPGLMLATGMPIQNATASSLVAVAAFGLTTTINYSLSGLVNWPLVGVLVGGGLVGGVIGARAARKWGARRGILNKIFAAALVGVAVFMLAHAAGLL